MPDKEEIQEVIDALWKVYDIRNDCQGNTEVYRRIKEVAKTLAARDDRGTEFGGIRKNIAEAIMRSYLNASLDHL